MAVLWPAVPRCETVTTTIPEGCNMESAAYPAAWYLLWAVIAACGVGTWFLRNFTQRLEETRLVAFTGVAAMVVMVVWTFTEF